MTELWQGLKQRKLVQWALAFATFAFAPIHVLDVIAHPRAKAVLAKFGLPCASGAPSPP
jgi:hypothetical protein